MIASPTKPKDNQAITYPSGSELLLPLPAPFNNKAKEVK